MQLTEIGVIRSQFPEPEDPFKMKNYESTIEIDPKFQEGLFDIKEGDLLEVLFIFHKSEGFKLKLNNYYGEKKGVFASRSPKRPSPIGMSQVNVLKVEGRRLTVKGLDAIDGTPVIDIKPVVRFQNNNDEHDEFVVNGNPRRELVPLIKNNKARELLTGAGMLHGHYCPGLALGVMAALTGLRRLDVFSEGMEKLIAVIEINSCFADGVQWVTGSTLGNNSLIYRDLGKTAVTLIHRQGKGVRLVLKGDLFERLSRLNPDFHTHFKKVIIDGVRDEESQSLYKTAAKEASFDIIRWPVDELFAINDIDSAAPDYAPIRKSVTCASCGESIMGGKEMMREDQVLCRVCGKGEYHQVDGTGICRMEEQLSV
jgi:formylmethanofuran dehydrogenase subunit E